MAFGMKEIQKWGIFGAIVGAVVPILAALFTKISLPGVSISQATISITATTPDTGLAGWLLGILNFSPSVPGAIPFLGVSVMTLLMGALGGALFMVVGALIADLVGLLKGGKLQKVVAAVIFGTLGATAIPALVAGEFSIQSILNVPQLLVIGVNALIIGYLLVLVDDNIKTKLIP